jgi:hypothetical protein
MASEATAIVLRLLNIVRLTCEQVNNRDLPLKTKKLPDPGACESPDSNTSTEISTRQVNMQVTVVYGNSGAHSASVDLETDAR